MTKNLSKQICEKCGIEPIKNNRDNCKNVNCILCNPPSVCQSCYRCKEDVYPDFGQPENFVRLLELQFQVSDCSIRNMNQYITDHIYIWHNRKQFLIDLLNQLDRLEKVKNSLMFNSISKAIREAEWKYV